MAAEPNRKDETMTTKTETTEQTYRIAFVMEGSLDGKWDIAEEFEAKDDDAANAYAEQEYPGQEWYVINDIGVNING